MRRSLVGILIAVAVLVATRIALPHLVAAYVNRALDRSDGYEGRVADVDLALWRGAYAIDGLRLDHREKRELRPLLAAERIDLALQWSALLHGALVGRVHVRGLVYNVVAAPPHEGKVLAQSGEEPDLAERISALFPLSINELEVEAGQIHYRDPYRSPKVDVALTEVHLLARNWSNVRHDQGRRFGRAWARGTAFGSARFAASLEADPLASPPEFSFALMGEGIQLAQLNDFLRAYGGFDVDRGRLDVYTEVEAKDARFRGYLKPVVSDLDVLGEGDQGWADRIWEGLVGVVAEVFQNQQAGRQATEIPIEGDWGDAKPGLVRAIGNVLYNAFIQALPRRLEHPERLRG